MGSKQREPTTGQSGMKPGDELNAVPLMDLSALTGKLQAR